MKKIIKVFLAGIITGILIAPRKGSATRKKLKECFSELTDAASGGSADIAQNFDNLL